MQIAQPITLPFTRESALQALRWGTMPESSPFSHKAIAEWCDRFWRQYMDLDPPAELERLLPILADVDCQWDIFLSEYHAQLAAPTLGINEVELPIEWFKNWLREAEA